MVPGKVAFSETGSIPLIMYPLFFYRESAKSTFPHVGIPGLFITYEIQAILNRCQFRAVKKFSKFERHIACNFVDRMPCSIRIHFIRHNYFRIANNAVITCPISLNQDFLKLRLIYKKSKLFRIFFPRLSIFHNIILSYTLDIKIRCLPYW